ncbi:MAG: UDP-N-acetylmuramoyl-L-alanyl-D-glutamate--2,6-diaminopimelate ligase [Neisseria sp.]|nr:UDP-N-acetylmuramoyl-L-alanyl-D-glutamate--2,6-diaminopimelate ligase [Neisseria sp.]
MFSMLTPLAETDFPPLPPCLGAGGILQADSRLVRPGDAFVACQGEYADGRRYIGDALAKGASFVFWDDEGGFAWPALWHDVPNMGIRNLRERAGMLAARVYGNLEGGPAVWGVTGTNGKTSVTQWLAQAAGLLGGKTAIIGTVGNGFWGDLQDTDHTTPDPVSVQTLLYRFGRQGARNVAMEVSSHGLHQFRANGVRFETAVFTNLTRDHLDYHGSMDAYGETKARLFFWQGLRHAIINIDDGFGAELAGRLKRERRDLAVYGYGFSDRADIRIVRFDAALDGMRLSLDTPWGKGEVAAGLLGRFNAQNLAACVGVLCTAGYPLHHVSDALAQIRPASGRMDCIMSEGRPLVVVDYAHTPDALEKALAALREIRPQGARLWCVFGCGGNRDKGKRPLMGAAAARGADKVVVTSDNPRLEMPEAIIADILPAVPDPACVEPDRKKAIRYAVHHASAGDIVLIAGKGHEDYQDIQGEKHRFSDFDTAKEALAGR